MFWEGYARIAAIFSKQESIRNLLKVCLVESLCTQEVKLDGVKIKDVRFSEQIWCATAAESYKMGAEVIASVDELKACQVLLGFT